VKSETVALIETVVETNEEVTTEDTRTETDKVGDSIVTTVATEATTVTAATGIVQSVKIQTSHSVPNAIGAESLAAVEAVDETMTAEAAETTEDTRAETDKVDDSIGATETTTVTVATGIVQSVKIQTSHSEPNVTDAVNLVAAEAEDETMTVEEAGTTVAIEVDEVVRSTMTTIGIVQSVKIQTSHSEPNAIGVVSLAAVEAVAEATEAGTVEDIRTASDKVEDLIETTEATEAVTKIDAMATGIVQSVKIQTSHSEPNATDVVHHEVEEGAVELVETPAIALGDTTLEDDLPVEIQESAHHEEKASDHQEGTVETDVLNVSTKAVVHTTKIVLKATSVNQYAKPENHAHFANPEETDLAMPTTDLRNH